MKCRLKNESNYFVTFKYSRLIVQHLQTVTNANFCQFSKAVLQTYIWCHIFKTSLTSCKNKSQTGLIRL